MSSTSKNESLLDPKSISPTAHIVAYLRTFSDIPYSNEIAELTDSKRVSEEWDKQLEALIGRAPIFEARFKGISDLVKETGSKTIIEIAAGVSPRGLIMTEDLGIEYIETDLPDMALQIMNMIEMIKRQKGIQRDNLQVVSANALESDELRRAVPAGHGKITIAGEGLLLYLDRAKKDVLASVIHKLLSENGGFWVTDTSLRSEFQSDDTVRTRYLKNVATKVGIDLHDVAFESDHAFEQFARDNGFAIEKEVDLISYMDRLSCVRRLALDPKQTDKFLRGRKLYVLKPAI